MSIPLGNNAMSPFSLLHTEQDKLMNILMQKMKVIFEEGKRTIPFTCMYGFLSVGSMPLLRLKWTNRLMERGKGEDTAL